MGGGRSGRGSSSTGSTGSTQIPPSARKLVQGIREIVNCGEVEVFAALQECGMDPDAAFNLLISQDTFHEVRNKRDKKKEIKETTVEPRARSGNSTSNRGNRSSADRGAHMSSSQSTHDETASRVKPASTLPTSSILGTPAVPTIYPNQKPSILGVASSKNIAADGHGSYASLPSSGSQNNWSGMSGHMSMADIVKMGRPRAAPTHVMPIVSNEPYATETAYPLNRETGFQSEQEHNNFDMSCDGAVDNLQLYCNEWGPSLTDKALHGAQPALSEASVPASQYAGTTEMLLVDASMEGDVENRDELLKPTGTSDRKTSTEVSEGEESPANEDGGLDVSSTAVGFQHLSIHSKDGSTNVKFDENPAVIIPNHLQISDDEVPEFSFGTFGSSSLTPLIQRKSLKSDLEETSPAEDESTPDQSDVPRDHKFYNSVSLTPLPSDVVVANLDMPSVTQADLLRAETLEAAHELPYNLPSSVSDNMFSSAALTNPTDYAYAHSNTRLQNLSPFSSILHPNSLQNSSLLTPSSRNLRDFEIPLSSLIPPQSMVTKSAIPMPENARTGSFMHMHQAEGLPSSSGGSVQASPTLPQHLALHHYTQATMPVGPFAANLIGYPYLPPSYAYMPPAPAPFQQPYSGNGSPFHQSAVTLPSAPSMKYSVPHYKTGVSATSLPQHSSVVSSYGGGSSFGNLSNVPGNYPLNSNSPVQPTNLGFDDALSAQFKDPSHYLALQQSENAAMWVQGGAGSRTMSAAPNNIYGYQGQQNQQSSLLRQSQQALQLNAHGYTSFYNPQVGVMQDRQQNPGSGGGGASSGNGSAMDASHAAAASQQPPHQQLWQHSY